MAGLRGHHRDFDSGAVAHFADKNDFRRLTESGAQSSRIIVKVVSELALVESRFALWMHILDRVFQRDDVNRLRFVDLVENGGQRSRLAAAGRTGNQDKAGLFLGDLVKDFWQPQ